MKFFFKYARLNISCYKKHFVPMFIVFTVSLVTLIYAFSMSRTAKSNSDISIENYPFGVGITTDAAYLKNNTKALIGFDLASKLTMPEYVNDYYIVEEMLGNSPSVQAIIPPQMNSGLPFSICAYSDIGKSIDFTNGKRSISEGRFANAPNECNISKQLADLNKLTIGSEITITLWNSDIEKRFTIVGIYSDTTIETEGELQFLGSHINENTGDITMAGGVLSPRRNNVLTKLTQNDGVNLIKLRTAYYYMKGEQAIYDFNKAISTSLPEQFVAIDTTGALKYIRLITDGVNESYLWLLAIAGIICCILYALLISNLFKLRTYDIGVLRSRGLSRQNTALLFSAEVLIISTLSFVSATIIYFITFVPLTNLLYFLQRYYIVNHVIWNFQTSAIRFTEIIRAYSYNVSLGGIELVLGFVMSLGFALAIGITAALYISRNEPMKTMIEY